MCNETVCKASGYKECSVCGDVMKSQCTKGRCTVDKIKPLMSSPWYDVEKKLNRSGSKGNKKGKRKINILIHQKHLKVMIQIYPQTPKISVILTILWKKVILLQTVTMKSKMKIFL